MRHTKSSSNIVRRIYFFLLAFLLNVGFTDTVLSQERTKYLRGEDNTLEMVVHIIGEVRRPGKYRVPDNTNLIELLSEAGGPTEFSSLSNVTITHADTGLLTNEQNGANHKKRKRIIKYNVNEYLKKDRTAPAPILKPGDVVMVPTNKWRTWRTVAIILRDLAVVASAYFLYLRAVENN